MLKISQSRYAALIGVSRNAVNKAVKAGHISAGIDPETKKIIVETANAEWGNAAREKHLKDIEGASITPSVEFIELSKTPLSEGLSFQEARRREQIYRAEMARIQALKEGGKYVSLDAVNTQLFEMGKHIRKRFESLPDRLIDDILAAKDRHTAHNVFKNAIHTELTDIANMGLEPGQFKSNNDLS